MKKKTKVVFNCLVFIATSILLVACDDAKKSAKNISEQYELQGSFSADCAGVETEGLNLLSSKDQIEFTGNQLKINTVYYSDSNCREESEVGRAVYDGEFEVERKNLEDIGQNIKHTAENVAESVEGVVKSESERKESAEKLEEEQKKEKENLDAGVVTFNIKEVYVEPKDQTMVSLLNGISFCGLKDFEKDKRKSLTKVSGETFCPVKEVPIDLNGTYVYNEDSKELLLSNQPTDMQEGQAKPSEENTDVVIPNYSLTEVFAAKYKKD